MKFVIRMVLVWVMLQWLSGCATGGAILQGFGQGAMQAHQNPPIQQPIHCASDLVGGFDCR